jgi:hypothetical protein
VPHPFAFFLAKGRASTILNLSSTPTVSKFPEKLPLTKVGQEYSLFLRSLPKISTERFAAGYWSIFPERVGASRFA